MKGISRRNIVKGRVMNYFYAGKSKYCYLFYKKNLDFMINFDRKSLSGLYGKWHYLQIYRYL